MKKFFEEIFLIIIAILIAYWLHVQVTVHYISHLLLQDSMLYKLIFVFQVFIIFLVINIIYHFLFHKKDQLKSIEKEIFKYGYLILLIVVLFYRQKMPQNYSQLISLSPFGIFNFDGGQYTKSVYIFNILCFFPLGFFFNRKLYQVILLFFGIEILQVVLKVGYFDVSDMILYFIGYSVGAIFKNIWRGIKKIKK